MNDQVEAIVSCPFCGELITILIDCSVSSQHYIEDCQVCCQPINIDAVVGESGDVVVNATNDYS